MGVPRIFRNWWSETRWKRGYFSEADLCWCALFALVFFYFTWEGLEVAVPFVLVELLLLYSFRVVSWFCFFGCLMYPEGGCVVYN